MRTVRDLLASREIHCIGATDTVREAVKRMRDKRTSALLVKSGDAICGILTERDVVYRVVNEGFNPDEIPVKDVMSSKLIHVHMDDELRMAKALMAMNRVRHLVVEGENRELLGLLSMRDFVDLEVKNSHDLIHELNERYYEEAYRAKWWISSNRVIVEPYVPKH